MADIAMAFRTDSDLIGDILFQDGDLVQDSGVVTSVIISLFTDARADVEEKTEQDKTDLRGWWADALDSDSIGSKLWLLTRGKLTNETLSAAKSYAENSLAWLITDGVAEKIEVNVERIRFDAILLNVVIYRANRETVILNFDFNWQSQIEFQEDQNAV